MDPDEWEEIGSGEYGIVQKVSEEFARVHFPDATYPIVCKTIEHLARESAPVMNDSAIQEIICNKHLQAVESPCTIKYIRVDIGPKNTKLYMRGYSRTLFDYLKKYDPDPERIRSIMRQILTAVHSLHKIGIVHRDVKPENLFMDDSRHVVLGDYGFATFVKNLNHPNEVNSMVQTEPYRAPEVFLGQDDYGVEIDMWSVGCVMFELFNRRRLLKKSEGYLKRLFTIFGLPSCQSLTGLKNYYLLEEMEIKPLGTGYKLHTPDPLANDLIQALLNVDPRLRISAVDALNHAYFKSCELEPADPIDVCGELLKKVPVFRIPATNADEGMVVYNARTRQKLVNFLAASCANLPPEDLVFSCDLLDLFFAKTTVRKSQMRLLVYACLYFAAAVRDNVSLGPDVHLEREIKHTPGALLDMQVKILTALDFDLGFTSLVSLCRAMLSDPDRWSSVCRTLTTKIVPKFKLRFYPLEALAVAVMRLHDHTGELFAGDPAMIAEITSIIES
jgi:serine/threonine protein kinase